VYVNSPDETVHSVIKTAQTGPKGEQYCWYQCTIKGGREGREVDAVTLALACEELGAGEILLNCIDRDGTNFGFDIELINAVKKAVTIPVIASSGAGSVEHFYEVFTQTGAEAALAAGIFHRKEVPIVAVKEYLQKNNVEIRASG
jgi:glutamine amidotransferase/cyclase